MISSKDENEEFYDALDVKQEEMEENNEEFYDALDTSKEEVEQNNNITKEDNDSSFEKIKNMKIKEGLTGYAYNYIYTAVEKKTEQIINEHKRQFLTDVGNIIKNNLSNNVDWKSIDIDEIKDYRNKLDMLCYEIKRTKNDKLDEWKRMYETRLLLPTKEEIKEGKKQRAEFLKDNNMKLKDLHLKSIKTGLSDLYLLISLRLKRIFNFNYVRNSNKVIKEIFDIQPKLELLDGVLYMAEPTKEYNEMVNKYFLQNKKYLALVKGICVDESDVSDFDWNKFNEFRTKGITSDYDLEKFKMLNEINKSAIGEFKEIRKYLSKEIKRRGKLRSEELKQYKQETKKNEEEKKKKEKQERKKKELTIEDKTALKAYKKAEREKERKKMGMLEKVLDTVREVLFINKLFEMIGVKISIIILGEENYEKVQQMQIEQGKEMLKNQEIEKTAKIDMDEINDMSSKPVENKIKGIEGDSIVKKVANLKEEIKNIQDNVVNVENNKENQKLEKEEKNIKPEKVEAPAISTKSEQKRRDSGLDVSTPRDLTQS